MYKTKEEINNFYRSLRNGDRIIISRDLSRGRELEDMEQTLALIVNPRTRPTILSLLRAFPVVHMEVEARK